MGHTNSTTNYALPQFIGTDKPAWLTDVNNAYSAIDTAIKNAQDDATQAISDAGSASTAAGNAANAASTAQSTATAASNQATTNASAITTLQGRCSALELAVGNLTAAKHVVSSSVISGWDVDEYSDGTVRMTYKGNLTFTAAGTSINGLYRSSLNVNLPVNVVVTGAKAYGSGSYSGRFIMPVRVNSASTVEVLLLSGAAFSGGEIVTDASLVVEATKA